MVNHPRRRQVRPRRASDDRRWRFAGLAVACIDARVRSSRTRAARGSRLRPDRVHRARDAQQRSGAHRPPAVGAGGRCRRWSSRSATPYRRRRCPKAKRARSASARPMVMLGYWRRPEATAATITPDRWLRTGDIGRLDDGRLYLSSRQARSHLPGRRERVPGRDREDHRGPSRRRGVRGVIGVDDPEFGQRGQGGRRAAARAHDRRRSGARVLRRRSSRTTRSRAVGGARPSSLPRNAAGKILKEPLRDAAPTPSFVEE